MDRINWRYVAVVIGAGFILGAAADSYARPAHVQDTVAPAAAVPFGPGERATYQVRLAGVGVGQGSLDILGTETVDGHRTYHARMVISGGVPLARVDNRLDSWIDVRGLFSRRYQEKKREVRYRRDRIYDFYPERGVYRRRGNDEMWPLPTNRPLDDLSFLYYARTLPLLVGDTYTLNQYFKREGNPVVLRVLRRETVRVPAGTFRTIVLRPVIQTDGLFGEGGQAEVYLSDDERRILVMIRSRIPVVGALTMHLESYRPPTRS